MAKKSYNPSHPSAPWRVLHRSKSYWFTKEKDADARMAEIARSTSAIPKPTARQLDELMRCYELLKGTPLLTAVRFWVDHHPTEVRAVPVLEAIEEFKKTFLDLRPKTVTQRTHHLRVLGRHFEGKFMGEVSRHAFEETLAGFASAHTANAFLKYSRQFFDWAVDKGMMAINPTREEGKKRKLAFRATRSTKVILTLADADHVVAVCTKEFPKLLAAVALQMFAGIRTEEIERLDWKHIRANSVFIPDDVAKMGHREGAARVIDWWPERLARLMPKDRPSAGPLADAWKKGKARLLKRCQETKADFVWGQNAFRHSYATYGCAYWQSSEKMMLLLGQREADVFFNSYRKYATEEQGKAYFA